jgi:hypothetical protein
MDRLVWLLLDLAAWWGRDVWRQDRSTPELLLYIRGCHHKGCNECRSIGFDGLIWRWDGWRPARYV